MRHSGSKVPSRVASSDSIKRPSQTAASSSSSISNAESSSASASASQYPNPRTSSFTLSRQPTASSEYSFTTSEDQYESEDYDNDDVQSSDASSIHFLQGRKKRFSSISRDERGSFGSVTGGGGSGNASLSSSFGQSTPNWTTRPKPFVTPKYPSSNSNANAPPNGTSPQSGSSLSTTPTPNDPGLSALYSKSKGIRRNSSLTAPSSSSMFRQAQQSAIQAPLVNSSVSTSNVTPPSSDGKSSGSTITPPAVDSPSISDATIHRSNKVASAKDPQPTTSAPSSTSQPPAPARQKSASLPQPPPPSSTASSVVTTPATDHAPKKEAQKKPESNTMTVETETVSAVPLLAVATTSIGPGSSIKLKKNTDSIHSKSSNRSKKKRVARVGNTKADFFAAKLASAVDEAQSSDSDETFVYESNPTERQRSNHTVASGSGSVNNSNNTGMVVAGSASTTFHSGASGSSNNNAAGNNVLPSLSSVASLSSLYNGSTTTTPNSNINGGSVGSNSGNINGVVTPGNTAVPMSSNNSSNSSTSSSSSNNHPVTNVASTNLQAASNHQMTPVSISSIGSNGGVSDSYQTITSSSRRNLTQKQYQQQLYLLQQQQQSQAQSQAQHHLLQLQQQQVPPPQQQQQAQVQQHQNVHYQYFQNALPNNSNPALSSSSHSINSNSNTNPGQGYFPSLRQLSPPIVQGGMMPNPNDIYINAQQNNTLENLMAYSSSGMEDSIPATGGAGNVPTASSRLQQQQLQAQLQPDPIKDDIRTLRKKPSYMRTVSNSSSLAPDSPRRSNNSRAGNSYGLGTALPRNQQNLRTQASIQQLQTGGGSSSTAGAGNSINALGGAGGKLMYDSINFNSGVSGNSSGTGTGAGTPVPNKGHGPNFRSGQRWLIRYDDPEFEDEVYGDLDENTSNDDEYYDYSETTPLRKGIPGAAAARRLRNHGSGYRAYSPHNYQRRSRTSGAYDTIRRIIWIMLALIVFLGLGFAMGFILASSKPLHRMNLASVFDVLVSDDELMFDVVVEGINPGYLSVEIYDLDLDVFARSPYVKGDPGNDGGDNNGLQVRLYSDEEVFGAKKWGEGSYNQTPPATTNYAMLLGNIQHFEVPLVFEGSIFTHTLQKAVGQLRLVNPGLNSTLPGDDDKDGDDDGSGNGGGDSDKNRKNQTGGSAPSIAATNEKLSFPRPTSSYAKVVEHSRQEPKQHEQRDEGLVKLQQSHTLGAKKHFDSGQKRWSRVNTHPFELILRGVVKYQLVLDRVPRVASITKVSLSKSRS